MTVDLGALPAWVLVVLVGLGVAQLALDVVAVVDLVRRPAGGVTFGNKWVWAAIIVFVNLLGAILYLALGRRPAPLSEPVQAARRGDAAPSSIADELYGKPGEGDAP